MLLYFSPADPETAKMVRELEERAYEEGNLILRTDPPKPTDQEYSISAVGDVVGGDPGLRRDRWIHQIEALQSLLQRVERYRHTSNS